MPRGRRAEDFTMLEMALVGYQSQKQKIEERIKEIQSQLRVGGRGRTSSMPAAKKAPGAKRSLSAAARARIAAAQRKRWAEHRKRTAQGK